MTDEQNIAGSEDFLPVLDGGCGACMGGEANAEPFECADDSLQDKVSTLDKVVDDLGGANSRSGKCMVAMSGGVDSSVIAAILTKLGYECVGVNMQFWADDTFFTEEQMEKFPENKCCSIESLEHAREIAHKYGMPFYVVNTRDSFKSHIVDYFIDGFKDGVTPNPCIECNRSIKFGFLLNKMRELECDYLATGHYAKVQQDDETGEYTLRMATDKLKDQSYFLYTLTQDKLKHLVFPLADMSKDDVRQIAIEEGLMKVAKKKDSQGICFFPEKSHVPFLKRHTEEGTERVNTSGPMLTRDGEVKGEHTGLAFYTIGQRQGLEIGGPGGPWYVIAKDPARNALIVGSNDDLFRNTLKADRLSFVPNNVPEGKTRILSRIRHRFTPSDAWLEVEDGVATVTFDDPQRAITPGQSIVFYLGDSVLGGGIIM